MMNNVSHEIGKAIPVVLEGKLRVGILPERTKESSKLRKKFKEMR